MMNCNDVQERLLEASDGVLPEAERGALHEHLAVCAVCRAELEELQRASEALKTTVPELAPAELCLTAGRLGRLLAAHERLADVPSEPRIFRLVTYRRFVAVAAAAAIAVSAGFIALNLFIGRQAPEGDESIAAETPAPTYVPVVLASAGQGEPMSIIRSIPVSAGARPAWDRPARGAHVVRTDSPGIRIPVDHAFYDPEESSHWW